MAISAREMTIGQLAKDTDTKVQTIRYYEQIGLLPEPTRTAGNQRRYGQTQRQRLAFIRHARALGFPLDDIRGLLGLADEPDRPCSEADEIAQHHLAEVNKRIERLSSLKTELERMVDQCAGGKVENCRVIEVLADHSLCLEDRHGDK